MSASRSPRLVAWLMLFLAVDAIAPRLPRVAFFRELHWNWQGQLLRAVVALAWIAVVRQPSAREAGLRFHVERNARNDALVATAMICATSIVAVVLGNTLPHDRETIAFELTLPGIAEELAYRGVVQGLLNRVFPKRRNVVDAKIGLGALVTAALFLFLHVVRVDASWHVSVTRSLATWIGVGTTGVLLGYIRERTQSLWPAILAHDAANGMLIAATAVLR